MIAARGRREFFICSDEEAPETGQALVRSGRGEADRATNERVGVSETEGRLAS